MNVFIALLLCNIGHFVDRAYESDWQKVKEMENVEQPWELIQNSDLFAHPNSTSSRRILEGHNQLDNTGIISFAIQESP